MFRRTFFLLSFGLAALPLRAEEADADRVADALQLTALVAIIHDEGMDYGDQIRDELFPDAPEAPWRAAVDRIHDAAAAEAALRAAFRKALPEAAVPEILDFLESERGRRIVALEISARRAMLDPDVADASAEAYAALEDANDPRLPRLEALVAAADLIEANVATEMNATLALYRGLIEGGAPGFKMTEDDALAEVRSQQDDIRAATEDWLFPYIAMAYSALGTEDLDAYIAFEKSAAGRSLSAALAEAFGALMADFSYRLGRAAAKELAGQSL